MIRLLEDHSLEKNLKNSEIDAKIATAIASHVSSEFIYCQDILVQIAEAERTNVSLSQHADDIEYCYNRMATILIDFKMGTLRKLPLVSSPYLVAYVPIMLGIQRLTLFVNSDRKDSLKKNTESLIELLMAYEMKAFIDRLNFIRKGSKSSLHDDLTGTTIFKGFKLHIREHQREGQYEYEPRMRLCLRDASISTMTRLREWFEPAIKIAMSHYQLYFQ
ncbi:hypothetical protein HDE_06855 [Halotydeus destructor]|nr:hypothetical protein HDE_06855 [Halotydeus destructor]